MKNEITRVAALVTALCLSGCVVPEVKGPEEASYLIRGSKTGGALDGPAEIWTSPSTRQATGHFQAGKPTGTWTFWDSRGAKIATLEYRDGVQSGTVEMWYGSFAYPAEVGRLKLRGSLLDGRWNGTVTTFYSDGQKRSERSYQVGVLVSSRGFDGSGHELTEVQAKAQAQHEDQADATYLAALDKTIRNSAMYAKPIP